MIKKFLPVLCLASFVVTSCDQPAMTTAASCPSAPVSVMKVTYQEAQGNYLVFHTESNAQKQLANPLHVANLQMLQIPKANGNDSDFARMNFKFNDGKCNPVLEMTQGFKIELQQSSGSSQTAQNGASSGSYWAPFLMGAVAGHLLSGSSHAAPAYYLPPPAGSQHVNSNGVVTGGVSAKNSDELNKKYESEYKQSNTKKGFFSRSNSSAQAPAETKKTGFFSNGSSSKRSSGGFFRKR